MKLDNLYTNTLVESKKNSTQSRHENIPHLHETDDDYDSMNDTLDIIKKVQPELYQRIKNWD